MAHTNSSGSRQDREQTELWTKGTEQPPSDSWKTESREDEEVKGWGEGDINEPRQELGDANSEGLERIRWTREEEYAQRFEDVSLYPPGPNDHEGWAYMFNVMPEAQPTFCRDVNGLMPGMDRRLRAIGNGVVPAVAATAWLNLTEKLTGVINENSNTRTSS